ncbi:uncharacterized protein DUF4062 [Vibrio crassostreae]|uniref:DUF4062 domain-containing protein n=1 Tax=Vibrio crassostreae TaxID=246167 RepID=UPI00104CD939|nr:DUF4062 domain-containing protein [Vibrio crassostreae]TCT42651.1 uncharacterized protein DUF4062 [Vibrio crassostreae]
MDKKYQVFVSSTYVDLKAERDQVIKAILEMGHIPVGMEMFSAADEEQWKIIQRQIDVSDYYVVITAHKYGSITQESISYTEKEYDYAVKQGVPALGFVLNDGVAWDPQMIESDATKKEKLERFISKVKCRPVNFWSDKKDLYAQVSIALMKTMQTQPRTGWIRSDQVETSPELVVELTRLSQENSSLRKSIAAAEAKNLADHTYDNQKLFDILSRNNRIIQVKDTEKDDWKEPIEGDLLRIFKAIAPSIIGESDTPMMSANIAVYFGDMNYHRDYPVPINHFNSWMADFVALGLIEPSKRKHKVSDTKDYWSLTSEGKEFMGSIRKLELERGVVKTLEELSEES